jgi:hypothetical protein
VLFVRDETHSLDDPLGLIESAAVLMLEVVQVHPVDEEAILHAPSVAINGDL